MKKARHLRRFVRSRESAITFFSRTEAKTSKRAKKKKDKVVNWKESNQALVDRGDFTLWIAEKVIEQWRHDNKESKGGRPFAYSDRAIETIPALRELFRRTYRSTEGFAKGIMKLMPIEAAIPDFTSLAKRAKNISVSLNASKIKGAVFLVVDGRGLKVRGEGECRNSRVGRRPPIFVRKHGYGKRRTGRKPHLAINEATQEIEAEVLTDNATDDAIRGIRKLGRAEWTRQVGCHRRSLSETAMWRRKTIFGATLKKRNEESQKTEARLRCEILNHFAKLALPKCVFE